MGSPQGSILKSVPLVEENLANSFLFPEGFILLGEIIQRGRLMPGSIFWEEK
jgi:hypothetical protein